MLKYTTIINRHLPSIDLHGMDRNTARFLAKEFIIDNYKLRNNVIVIIHGKGTGVLKKEVHDMLRKERIVKEFYLDYFNDGTTIVELNKIDKS